MNYKMSISCSNYYDSKTYSQKLLLLKWKCVLLDKLNIMTTDFQ